MQKQASSARSRLLLFTFCAICLVGCSGCFFTKLASVPMRAVASVISIIPGVGNTVHDAIDAAAETLDEFPI